MKNQETLGKLKNAKGRAKEAAGIITGNKDLEREGTQDRAEGAVQESIGKARRKLGDAVGTLARKIKE